MPAAFRIYRIICLANDKAFVNGSNHPNWGHLPQWGRYPAGQTSWMWWDRGSWARSGGTFYKTTQGIRGHLHNFCHDWRTMSEPVDIRWRRYEGECRYWYEPIPGAPDWSRLTMLSVEETHVTEYSTTKVSARDFMGIVEQEAAA